MSILKVAPLAVIFAMAHMGVGRDKWGLGFLLDDRLRTTKPTVGPEAIVEREETEGQHEPWIHHAG